MILDDFDFDLPKASIALRPASPRDTAKLLVVDPADRQHFRHSVMQDLPRLLRAGDVMVFNNTKVLRAELTGYRPARADSSPPVSISLTLIERLPDGAWKALARPARRLRDSDTIVLERDGECSTLHVTGRGEDGEVIVTAPEGSSVEAIMEKHGAMPLPPYIARTRPSDERDHCDYQTVYAEAEGAVAAPTAGLHFTPELLKRIADIGVRTAFVTLHVGPGTFLPVKADIISEHRLHSEWCAISDDAAHLINESRANGGRIVAVGTTSLRLLETAVKDNGKVAAYQGFTNLFIKPGHRFKSADLLLTNFHLPKSTLFMLVCAFSGVELMKQAYAHAISEGFRFYSYGDACLLHRAADGGST